VIYPDKTSSTICEFIVHPQAAVSSGDADKFYRICTTTTDSANSQSLPEMSNKQCDSTPGVVVFKVDQSTAWNIGKDGC